MLDLGQTITAVGGLGTAAFGLVDATKPISGVNQIGFSGIRETVKLLTPSAPLNSLSQEKIVKTLEANWVNGTDLMAQKAIAKSLIKLNLSSENAAALAAATGVDRDALTRIAKAVASGEKLTEADSDAFGRFDLIITALLDEAYQRSDQVYRNGTRMLAMLISVALALAGAAAIHKAAEDWGHDLSAALLVGLLATPLAPIAKDLASGLATAVNTMQAVRK
jgi:hypothetical protein